jgi:hypothetical protein
MVIAGPLLDVSSRSRGDPLGLDAAVLLPQQLQRHARSVIADVLIASL